MWIMLGCRTEDIIWISRRMRIRSASVSILAFLMVLMATWMSRSFQGQLKVSSKCWLSKWWKDDCEATTRFLQGHSKVKVNFEGHQLIKLILMWNGQQTGRQCRRFEWEWMELNGGQRGWKAKIGSVKRNATMLRVVKGHLPLGRFLYLSPAELCRMFPGPIYEPDRTYSTFHSERFINFIHSMSSWKRPTKWPPFHPFAFIRTPILGANSVWKLKRRWKWRPQ